MSNFYVEFEVAGEDHFSRLVAVFDALCRAKRSDAWRDDEYWLAFFDEEARAHFSWPTAEEDPLGDEAWDFGSLIDAFRNGEYDLLACRRVSPTTGRLEFDPQAWPYGGTGCMEALIEAFGHRVVAVED